MCGVAETAVPCLLGGTGPIRQLMGTNAVSLGFGLWGCTSLIYKPFSFSFAWVI